MQRATTNDLITIAEAAKRLGINRSTLSRQIRDGQVRAHGKRVRYSEVLADRAANIDLTRSARREGLTEAEIADRASASDATGDATPNATEERPDLEGGFVLVDGQTMPLKEARALKETYLARLRQQEFEVKAGTLVDRAAAEKEFFDCAREMRDAWTAWPARVVIEMAEEIRIDPETGRADPRSLVMVLDRYVRQHLTEMGEPDADVLKA